MGRIVGGVLAFLTGFILLFLTAAFAIGTYAQQYEGWWVSLPVGLPLVGIFFGLAWAAWRRRRLRPVLGAILAWSALGYTAFSAYATFSISRQVAASADLLAGIAFLFLIPLWVVVLLFTLLARLLLHREEIPWAPFVFVGISLGWLVAFWGFVGIIPPERLIPPEPEGWLAYGFFLFPSILALGLSIGLGKGRRSGA
ncbi:MAG: hypothetical protein NZ769_03400 [Anaerolineae bacterium]|nr:hypothetical protein [Anaerolineae bacterium]